ncbi:MAG: PD40 domain-containing protein [Rhodothermales bacterium]|nr:PD40 domain-containing protein [Rhodothermales bacterium]MBO6781178.1 PD40 domain-containing protein [Rhodothermales bacterium]
MLALLSLVLIVPQQVPVERIDLYDPGNGGYLGAETSWFSPTGNRLRLEITDPSGDASLLFFLRHDRLGREEEGVYFEGGNLDANWERFSYSGDSLKTTTYLRDDGSPGARTESILDPKGREIRKRYFRSDSTQYGREEVLWDEAGNQLGWDFSYVEREGGSSFRYSYAPLQRGAWTRRTRSRNGVAERLEQRSPSTEPVPVPFLPGIVSTSAFETSPSFSVDGQVMVFARYEDWGAKVPYIARQQDGAFVVRPLEHLGPVYNLALSPDGETVFFSREDRVFSAAVAGGAVRDLTAEFGIQGGYVSFDQDGNLFAHDPEIRGITRAPADGTGWAPPQPLFVPESGEAFDAVPLGDGRLLLTWCGDERCGVAAGNGLQILEDGSLRQIRGVPYAWGAQPVPALGILVFTDGDDILALPLPDTDLTHD